MISLIIFIVGVIITVGLNLILYVNIMPFWQILLIFAYALAFICAVNAIMAILCSKWLPNNIYNQDSKFFTPSKKEIRFYDKLNIKKWKDKTAEWGKLNGFSKSKIENPKDKEYIEKFILECNKGYLGHLLSIFASFLTMLVVPFHQMWLTMAVPMIITSFLINYLSVMILRYNVSRLKTLLKFATRNNVKSINDNNN